MRCTEIPDGLAVLPPGPGLSSALSAVELAAVPNDEMLEVVRAQYRQLCHEQARMAATISELGRCGGFPEPGEILRLPAPERFASEESRAALRWTRRAAEDEHELAEKVVNLWPAVFAAWLAGELDRPRVRVFDRYLTGLGEGQVASICEVVVPRAAGLTTGQLSVLLRRMVIAIDPEAAARWYRKAVAERNVIAYAAPDGTITLSANGLPADEAEAACVRLQDLAGKAKRAGHPGLIGQIRCDLFLGMLDGRFHHLTGEQVVSALLADYRADEERQEHEPHRSDGTAAPGSPDEAAKQVKAAETVEAEPQGHPPPGMDVGSARDERVGIEIRVGLATLLGLDELPAEIPGLGLLIAPDARRRVAMQGRAEWRFALTDSEGRLVFDGITRRRPPHIGRNGPPGGIVELHIPLALLNELLSLSAESSEEWNAVVADIAAQHSLADDRRLGLDAHPGSRLPGAALRRHTEIRDRTCTFTGCRRRAHVAEQDHTHDYQRGGATTRGNLGPLCPHDHRVKHRGGWRVQQPEPGTFVWRSPLGGEYRVTAEPLLPLMPEPVPVPVPDAQNGGCAGPATRTGRFDAEVQPAVTTILWQPRAAGGAVGVPRTAMPRGDPDEPPPF